MGTITTTTITEDVVHAGESVLDQIAVVGQFLQAAKMALCVDFECAEEVAYGCGGVGSGSGSHAGAGVGGWRCRLRAILAKVLSG